MRTRNVVLLAVAWIGSLAVVAAWAQSSPSAQTATIQIKPGDPIGPVITGADNIGFQQIFSLGAAPDGKISGTLMVKVNGRWLQAIQPTSFVR